MWTLDKSSTPSKYNSKDGPFSSLVHLRKSFKFAFVLPGNEILFSLDFEELIWTHDQQENKLNLEIDGNSVTEYLTLTWGVSKGIIEGES